jgi:hypothetical protein
MESVAFDTVLLILVAIGLFVGVIRNRTLGD